VATAGSNKVRTVVGALLYGFVTSAEGLPGLAIGASPLQHDTHVAAVADHQPAPAATTVTGTAGVFTSFALEHAARLPGRAIAVLQAGCTTADQDLDLTALRARGHDVDICYIDDESPVTRAAAAGRADLAAAELGDLRLVVLRPRTFDIVHCSLLLHRISHADVVLGRLVASLRPGGLLLLRITDTDSAVGFLDRRMPDVLRGLAWRASWPGQPGPHPAIYEPVASARGIEVFLSRHGLTVAHRDQGASPVPVGDGRAGLAARLVSRLSRGRLSCDHDELRYVVRRPVDRFARVLE
jgi:SAM-dependent methyltransferase